jgi:hypothetical protein
MTVNLRTLDLSDEQRQTAQEAIERMAYYHWLDSGSPCQRELDCWLAAERQWIEHYYVPPRPRDGQRPEECGPAENADEPALVELLA